MKFVSGLFPDFQFINTVFTSYFTELQKLLSKYYGIKREGGGQRTERGAARLGPLLVRCFASAGKFDWVRETI